MHARTHTHAYTHAHYAHSSTAATESESSEVAMERHRRQQEGIAEEMMGIARSLKDNALTAKNIITGDNQVYWYIM